MAVMEDLAELFSSLLSGGNAPENDEDGEARQEEQPQFDFGDFSGIGGIDFDFLMKIAGIFQKMNEPDKNIMLLNALQLHMRDENKDKVEKAKKIAKIISLLPYVKDMGLFKDLNIF